MLRSPLLWGAVCLLLATVVMLAADDLGFVPLLLTVVGGWCFGLAFVDATMRMIPRRNGLMLQIAGALALVAMLIASVTFGVPLIARLPETVRGVIVVLQIAAIPAAAWMGAGLLVRRSRGLPGGGVGAFRHYGGGDHHLEGTAGMTNASGRGRTGFWILIGILAATGLSMAFIVAFGLLDSTAYSLVWRVFVADLYLIASLAAQHTWLRWTAWVATAVAFVLGIVNVFWRFTPHYTWADGRQSYTVGDPTTGWSPWFGFEGDLEAAAHLIAAGVVALGFLSLAFRWVRTQNLLRAIYLFTFGAGLTSLVLGAALILDSPFRWDLAPGVRQAELALIILALTAAAIVIIGAFVQRKAALARGVAAPVAVVLPTITGDDRAREGELRDLVRGYVDEYLRERGL